jgi:hypothetical protein
VGIRDGDSDLPMKKPKSSAFFNVDEAVQWKWLGCYIDGVVKEVYFEPVEKTIKTKKIKRNGSSINPAYLVQSEAGNFALKLHSELNLSASIRKFNR